MRQCRSGFAAEREALAALSGAAIESSLQSLVQRGDGSRGLIRQCWSKDRRMRSK